MASKPKTRKSAPRKAAADRDRAARERLVLFAPPEQRSFAYADFEDEFEVPPIPSAFALAERQVSVAVKLSRPPSSFDLRDQAA